MLRALACRLSLLPGKEVGGFGTDPVPAFRCSVAVLGAPVTQQGSPGRGNVSSCERLGRSLGFLAFAARTESFRALRVMEGGGTGAGAAGVEASPFPVLLPAMGRPSPRIPRLRPGLARLACVDGRWAGSAQPLGVGPSPAGWLGGGFSPGQD